MARKAIDTRVISDEKSYTARNVERVRADIERDVVTAVRTLCKAGKLCTTRAIAKRIGDAATARDVRQVLRRLRRHNVVATRIDVIDGRRVRLFSLPDDSKAKQQSRKAKPKATPEATNEATHDEVPVTK